VLLRITLDVKFPGQRITGTHDTPCIVTLKNRSVSVECKENCLKSCRIGECRDAFPEPHANEQIVVALYKM